MGLKDDDVYDAWPEAEPPLDQPEGEPDGGRCSCRHPLPTHMIDLVDNDERYSSVCVCGNRYKVRDGRFILDGTQRNPLTGQGS